jgi:6-phosphofructokinase 1
MKKSRFGILTSGGDCPGLNAAIRSITKALLSNQSVEVIGFEDGFRGLIEGKFHTLTDEDVSGILTKGGTILGTSREKPFAVNNDLQAVERKPEKIKRTYDKMNLNGLFTLGGNGTQKTAAFLSKDGLNIIGVPKTIDNDIPGTDFSFGFNSAVSVATEAIDRLHSTAHSHNRVMIIETMGHDSGWLALYSGVAGGGDIILIPEIPYDLDAIADHLFRRSTTGKRFSIVVVAEGAASAENQEAETVFEGNSWHGKGYKSRGAILTDEIHRITGMETRLTVLGYLQRGGVPTSSDRILATQLGTAAAELALTGKFGRMTAIRENRITSIKFSDMGTEKKKVPMDHYMLRSAGLVGTCFGTRNLNVNFSPESTDQISTFLDF